MRLLEESVERMRHAPRRRPARSETYTLCSISELPYKPATSLERKSGAKRMRKIGYARVSPGSQNLDRQIGALRAERCHEIFREKASGRAIKGRPQLEKAIDALGKGDVLVVAEWDRATRSMIDGVHIIEGIHARGAMIKVLDKPYLDLTTPIGRGFIAFLSAMAEDERHRIVKRANDGRAAARKRGGPNSTW